MSSPTHFSLREIKKQQLNIAMSSSPASLITYKLISGGILIKGAQWTQVALLLHFNLQMSEW